MPLINETKLLNVNANSKIINLIKILFKDTNWMNFIRIYKNVKVYFVINKNCKLLRETRSNNLKKL